MTPGNRTPRRESRRAASYGADAEQYDRARPSYPAELVDDLLAEQPHRVVDIGCGTGIAGRPFVEHDPRMADVARRHGLVVHVARFESWKPPGGGLRPRRLRAGVALWRSYPWDRPCTTERWLDELPTHSDHRMLDDSTRRRLLDAVGDAVDRLGRQIVVHHETRLLTACRI